MPEPEPHGMKELLLRNLENPAQPLCDTLSSILSIQQKAGDNSLVTALQREIRTEETIDIKPTKRKYKGREENSLIISLNGREADVFALADNPTQINEVNTDHLVILYNALASEIERVKGIPEKDRPRLYFDQLLTCLDAMNSVYVKSGKQELITTAIENKPILDSWIIEMLGGGRPPLEAPPAKEGPEGRKQMAEAIMNGQLPIEMARRAIRMKKDDVKPALQLLLNSLTPIALRDLAVKITNKPLQTLLMDGKTPRPGTPHFVLFTTTLLSHLKATYQHINENIFVIMREMATTKDPKTGEFDMAIHNLLEPFVRYAVKTPRK